jgi:hypothetical protein
LIHQISKTGLENKTWLAGKNLESSMRGYANFVQMVKPEQGKKFQTELDKIFGERPKNPKTQKTDIVINPIITETPKPQNDTEDGKSWWEVL